MRLAILREVPHSVLRILDTDNATRERLGNLAERNGVARARLIFAPRWQSASHLARYNLADLVLDTTPFGAHTTAPDALKIGVPVLKRCRVGASRRASAPAWCARRVFPS
jgi:predicted O-linked N-acetylglucosamine transferase (SPINDLY family)